MSISFCDFLRKTVNSSCCIDLYMITTDEIVEDAQKTDSKTRRLPRGSRLLYYRSNVRTFYIAFISLDDLPSNIRRG